MSEQHNDGELNDPAYLRDLAERIRNVPVMYGTDGYDIDRLPDIADTIETAINCRDDLLNTLYNVASTLAIMQLPQLDDTVASNTQLIALMERSVLAAIAKAEGQQ